MTDEIKLLPCPFCSSTDIFIRQKTNHSDAECHQCGSVATLTIWNNRAEAKPEPSAVVYRKEAQQCFAKICSAVPVEKYAELGRSGVLDKVAEAISYVPKENVAFSSVEVLDAAEFFDEDNESAVYADGTCIGTEAMRHIQTLINAAMKGGG